MNAMTRTIKVVGAAALGERIARERADDPGGSIRLTDLGDGEYEIVVTASEAKDGSESVPNVRRKRTHDRVSKQWEAWR